MTRQIVILAAGKGTRMHSSKPKVLHELAGKMFLQYVLDATRTLTDYPAIVVIGHEASLIQQTFPHENVIWVKQKEQLGTGHALQQTLPVFAKEDQVLVVCGDVPLLKTTTLQRLINATPSDAVGMITAEIKKPRGYGRIKRNELRVVEAIVEEKDASAEEKKITEVNAGVYLFPGAFLQTELPRLSQNNSQQEFYLTDLIAIAAKQNIAIKTIAPDDVEEIFGINDKVQLAGLERYHQQQHAKQLMRAGVTLADPARFDLRGTLKCGKDVFIDINNIFVGDNHIGDQSHIGANCYLKNVSIGSNVHIQENSVLENCVVEDNCAVGPFARLRPNTYLKEKARVGNFVELKNTTLGKNSKANHLSYVGDATVGNDVNIGAGTITCNYDGASKHHTTIEDNAFIGSCSQLVAPITIGEGATIGAGSTVTEDAPAHQLTLARPKQTTIKNWQRPKKQKEV